MHRCFAYFSWVAYREDSYFTIFMPGREVAVVRTDVYGVGRRREGKVFRHFSRRYLPNFARSVSAYRDQPVLGGR